ncbi:lipoprotein [Vibrio sp. MACH09]|uniref:hypothetical protein n=1 Tax=Vibrio sp. MACH09 TaxID=3025122 RepID=UPI00278F7B4B|nr:hypothetical protein [Vibrio sp. MACH09]GLO62544.1 lipoprotein [Vibrio sp. MACH09]
MKKSILVTIVTGSLLLAGCSSSGGSSSGGGVADRPEPVDPNFGLTVPSVPDIDNSPDWGLDTGNTPDRLPPVWGGPAMPPIDNGPEAGYTISGNTITDANGNSFLISDVDWRDQSMTVLDKEGNEYHVSIIRQGEFEGNFGVIINGESIIIGNDTVQGGLRPLMENSENSIDRNSIRDAIRSRLN